MTAAKDTGIDEAINFFERPNALMAVLLVLLVSVEATGKDRPL